jgi:K+-sensing histidine kinase KdpD
MWKWLVAVVTVSLVVTTLKLASVDHAAVAAPLLLLNVVVVARLFGFGPALVAAGIGAGAYSYFFIPPEGFGLESPDDWIAFVTFTVTAVIAGELASRAERRAAEAQAGRVEIERLYQELRNAFERASEAEAARRNEALKAALLDALSHNLRTPLTAIKAAVTALIRSGVRDEPELPVEDRCELLQVINEETDRLNRFIEGLATTDRGEASQPAQVREATVGSIVRAGLTRAETVTRNHRLTVEVPDELPGVVVDPASMIEAIYILLDNASKYAPRDTTIRVAVSLDDEQRVRIRVSDQGPGIPEELRERVFEKFFRVPGREPLDPRRAGAGLGLPIARRLVEAQAGRIWIDSSTGGRGTCVVVQLPAAAPAETATVSAAPAMNSKNGEQYDNSRHDTDGRTFARAGSR